MNSGLPYLNTSHVIFYLIRIAGEGNLYKFKYISCYLLSVSMPLMWNTLSNLNTSHVIFYRFH